MQFYVQRMNESCPHPHLPPCSSSITKVLIPASLLYASRAMEKKRGKEGETHGKQSGE